jgi:hypothetical protein
MSDADDFVSREEMEAMVLARTVEDPAFAARLKADPKAALAEMFDTQLPETLKVHVFQETPTDLMLRLPVVADGELSEQELGGVAGGFYFRSGVPESSWTRTQRLIREDMAYRRGRA